MLITQLPILQVIIPLICAPVCVMVRNAKLVFTITILAVWAVFFIACWLLIQVMETGTITYTVGGWAAPWGIEYRLDRFSTFVSLFVSGLAAVLLTGNRDLVAQEIAADRHYLFYAILLLNLTGLLGVVATGDAFNLFVFIEITSLSSYALISLGKDKHALLAAYEYLIFGSIGATFFLIAVGLLYMMTGTLNIADIQARLPALLHTSAIKTALVFFTIGIAIKCALFPFHSWLPAAYTYAPSTVAAFFSGTTTKVFIYVLIRFFYSAFGIEYIFNDMYMDIILMSLASVAIFYGAIMAARQDDLRGMLAWSSVGQLGYIILAISLNSVIGLAAAIIHMFNHALIKSTLFLCVGAMICRFSSSSISALQGKGKLMPWTMVVFIAAGFGLVGIPLTVGFVSKWYLIQASVERGLWVIVFAIVGASIVTLFYLWRMLEVVCFKSTAAQQRTATQAISPTLIGALSLLLILNICFGINMSLVADLAMHAASLLLGAEDG